MSFATLLPRPWRLPYALIWLAVATALSVAALQDYHRGGGQRDWEPVLWEFSSVACVAPLALGVHAGVGWLRRRSWRVQVLAHGLGALAYTGLHVAGMSGLRFAVYAWVGATYERPQTCRFASGPPRGRSKLGSGPSFSSEPGPWSTVLVYEAAKDVVSYASFVLISRGVWVAQSAARLERELAAARLARLADQVQPHFLFNTLNLISSAMYEDVARADRLLCQLADLLRQTTAAQQRSEHSLAEELGLIEPFLALMQARFGAERLVVRIEADTAARAWRVPALLLLAPVENAIKHDVARHRGRVTVALQAQVNAQALTLTVQSQGEHSTEPDPGQGVGLANVRERLAARYGAAARVEFTHLPRGARLRITLSA